MADISAFLQARYGEIAAQTRQDTDDPEPLALHTRGRYTLIALPTLSDERVTPGHPEGHTGTPVQIAYWDRAHVQADLDAKRQRLRLHRGDVPTDGNGNRTGLRCEHDGQAWPCPDLRLDALPFADHPDYEPDWRPAQPSNQPRSNAS